MPRSVSVELFSVFAEGPGGGNPCPVVAAADDLSPTDMLAIARHYGHESAFLLTPTVPDVDGVRLRYFVPKHEMQMCVHATEWPRSPCCTGKKRRPSDRSGCRPPSAR